MPRERGSEFPFGDTGTVIANPYQLLATRKHLDIDLSRTGVQAVLHEFLDDRSGPFDNLAGGNLIDEVAGKFAYGHGDG